MPEAGSIFLYGVPVEKKQLQDESRRLDSIKSYEVAFHRYNFLHLTGVRMNGSNTASAIHFYEKCLNNRLKQEDFNFAKDGSTIQKLDILENMMRIKWNATMIGEFTNRGPKLFAEKADKGIGIKKCCFSEEIEKMLEREIYKNNHTPINTQVYDYFFAVVSGRNSKTVPPDTLPGRFRVHKSPVQLLARHIDNAMAHK